MTGEDDHEATKPTADGRAESRCVWAILRTDRLVLAISDAEIVLVHLRPGESPGWLPPVSGLIESAEPAPTIDEVAVAGTVRTRIPREELAFAEVSGSVLMIQGATDIPYVLAAHEAAVARAVAERLTGRRGRAILADVAKDIWKWNVGMLVVGILAVVVPLFEASWGITVIAAALMGFGLRRPVCYLAYAAVCLGGAVTSSVSHLHTPLGGWFGTIWLMLGLAVLMVLRFRYFRHVRTTGMPDADLVPAWLGPTALAVALAACLLSAGAVHVPAVAERLVPDEAAAAVVGEIAARLPGHLGVLAAGLALGTWRRRRPAKQGSDGKVAAILLGLVLFAALIARSAAHGPEPRIEPPEPVSTE